MTPLRSAAQTMVKMQESMGAFGQMPMIRNYFAMLDVAGNAQVTHSRPPFNITSVEEMVTSPLVDVVYTPQPACV